MDLRSPHYVGAPLRPSRRPAFRTRQEIVPFFFAFISSAAGLAPASTSVPQLFTRQISLPKTRIFHRIPVNELSPDSFPWLVADDVQFPFSSPRTRALRCAGRFLSQLSFFLRRATAPRAIGQFAVFFAGRRRSCSSGARPQTGFFEETRLHERRSLSFQDSHSRRSDTRCGESQTVWGSFRSCCSTKHRTARRQFEHSAGTSRRRGSPLS